MRIQRRIQKPIHEVFNDGFLEYGHDVTQRVDGKRVGGNFVAKGRLAYQEMSARDQDYHFAGSMGSTLDLKVKTYLPPDFKDITKTNLKCAINNVKYDVIKADHDNQYLYFYLQKVGVLDESKK